MSKELTAAKLFDDMIENYRNVVDDPEDLEQADRFLDAAIALCELEIPNPFADLRLTVNAAVKPSDTDRLITGVAE